MSVFNLIDYSSKFEVHFRGLYSTFAIIVKAKGVDFWIFNLHGVLAIVWANSIVVSICCSLESRQTPNDDYCLASHTSCAKCP